ncbi:MAG: hypothetical protein RI897_4209 [Verrucomicrobiota bacterium]
MDIGFAGGGDDAAGDDVAIHDTAEDIDEDGLDVGVLEDDAECGGDLFSGGAAADIEEVGGLAAVVTDDIHGSHGESGAIDEAGDIAVELDIIQFMLAGLGFKGGFLADIAEGQEVFVAVEGVVVEADLGIDRKDIQCVVVFADEGERVDFDEGGVAFPPSAVGAEEEFGGGVDEVTGEAEGGGLASGLVGLVTEAGVDAFADDLFR